MGIDDEKNPTTITQTRYTKRTYVNFSNLREDTRIQIQKANKTSNRQEQKIKSARHIIFKTRIQFQL